MKKYRHILLRFVVIGLLLGVSQFAKAACNITIVSAGPCLADGTAGNPKVGEGYGLKLVFNISGTPSQHFNIVWTLANASITNLVTVGQGNGYVTHYFWDMDLDDGIPWSIQIDPAGVSGNTNPTKTASGTLTPTPPTTAVELFDPLVWQGQESFVADFQQGSGTIDFAYIVFGKPTTHGAQSVFSVTPPADSTDIVTDPYGETVTQIAHLGVPAATFQDTNTFIVLLSRIRVNPTILRTNTWDDLSAMSTNWSQWLAPDTRCQSTDPSITSFVAASLPADFKTTMTPYDTARSLHQTVARTLTYQEPPPHIDAVNVLADKIADCGGYSALLVAAYRNIGIPARCISGFRQGENIPHVRVEFHLPGAEWLVADPTDCNTNDPTASFAFSFGVTSDSSQYVAVDYGDAHVLPYNTFEFIQVPNLWWSGAATLNSYTFAYGLTTTPTVIGLANPTDGGTVTGDGTFTPGANVPLTAVASNGWSFTGWSDGNTQNPRTVNVPATGTNFTANFIQPLVDINVGGNLAFGNVVTGTTTTATLIISNPGITNLTVSSITYPDPAFSGAYSGVIPPGGTQNVTVAFAPTSIALSSGTVTVNSDAVEGTDTTTASGTGVALPPSSIATPTITPDGGDFADYVKVKITSATAKSVVHYTIDGSDPTIDSPLGKGTITVTNSATLKAVAYLGTNTPSAVASASFVISTPSITTVGPLPDGAVGTTYSGVTLAATGGTAPYKWKVMGTKLPTGLKLNSSTGVISGIPKLAGTVEVTVEVKDAKKGIAEQTFSVTID